MNDARIERVARALCSVDGLDPDRPGAPRRVTVDAEEREVATSTCIVLRRMQSASLRRLMQLPAKLPNGPC
jgi:hypothetical protein